MTTLEKINRLSNEQLEEYMDGNFTSIEAYINYKHKRIKERMDEYREANPNYQTYEHI